MSFLLRFMSRSYRLLLQLYAEAFRADFAEEMQAVYESAATEAARQGPLSLARLCLRELLDLPPHLLQEYQASISEQWQQYQANVSLVADLPSSRTATLAALALFLVAGLELALGDVGLNGSSFTWLASLRTIALLGLLLLSAVGFGVGWIQGFPRWSYPYVMLMIMLSLYLMKVATPGLHILTDPLTNGEPWGWRAWIPGGIMAAIALGITRSLQPAVQLFANVWDDWTLLTWGMCGTMPLLIKIGFEKVDSLYSLPFIVLLTLVMSATATAYLRCHRRWHQIAVLLMGVLVIVSTVAVVPSLYWRENSWDILPNLMLGTMVVAAAMFSPIFIGLLHRSLNFLRTP